jgi:transposase
MAVTQLSRSLRARAVAWMKKGTENGEAVRRTEGRSFVGADEPERESGRGRVLGTGVAIVVSADRAVNTSRIVENGTQRPSARRQEDVMDTGYRRCCGIDVHKKSISVCVLPPVGTKGAEREERFRTFTRDLKRLKLWLINCRVTEVAMESAGQYWRPVWNILEGGVARLLLLNPAHVKGLAGRRTDRLDAHWLATRLEREDLRGSFIPPPEVRELRDLTRLRVHWLQDLNRVKNRIGQLCEAGNIKVSSVATDLFGKSGRLMLKALAEGQRDPGWMADYAQGTLRNKKDQLEMALQGTFSEHRRLLLRRMLAQLGRLEEEIGWLTEEIRKRMAAHEDEVRRLCRIPGVDRTAAWTMGFEVDLRAVALEPKPATPEVSQPEPMPVPTRRGPGRPCHCSERGIPCPHRNRPAQETPGKIHRMRQVSTTQVQENTASPPESFS